MQIIALDYGDFLDQDPGIYFLLCLFVTCEIAVLYCYSPDATTTIMRTIFDEPDFNIVLSKTLQNKTTLFFTKV